MMIKEGNKIVLLGAAIILMSLCPSISIAGERVQPYKGYTGTVHQFGFIGGMYILSNPNYSEKDPTRTFHDWGLGVVYNLHDYVTRQFTYEVLSSVTIVTAKSLELRGYDDNKKKIIWPVDCRCYLGPSEDFQAFLGLGLQWNYFEKNVGAYSLTTGTIPTKTIHQFCGNTAIGLNFLGPQKYMFHFNVGAKFHFPIANNDNTVPDGNEIDLSKDRGCVVLNGGITFDIDRRKNACIMLNYEYPLGTPKSNNGNCGGFFSNTQTISLGVVFHIGGTR